MQDFIPSGTGNSRYLKSVSNFLTLYPDYETFVAALVAGTLPIDFNGINNSGVQQTGTALNKANLLSDTTAQAYFPSTYTTSTPNDVLNVLTKSVLYDNSTFTDISSTNLRVGKYQSGNYTGTGPVSPENNPTTISVGFPTKLLIVCSSDNGYSSGSGTASTTYSMPIGIFFNFSSSYTASKTIVILRTVATGYSQDNGDTTTISVPNTIYSKQDTNNDIKFYATGVTNTAKIMSFNYSGATYYWHAFG